VVPVARGEIGAGRAAAGRGAALGWAAAGRRGGVGAAAAGGAAPGSVLMMLTGGIEDADGKLTLAPGIGAVAAIGGCARFAQATALRATRF